MISSVFERKFRHSLNFGIVCIPNKIKSPCFHLLIHAKQLGTEYLTDELVTQFLSDDKSSRSGEYRYERFLAHNRCIRFLESYLETGKVSINKFTGWDFQPELPDFRKHFVETPHSGNGCYKACRIIMLIQHVLDCVDCISRLDVR